MQRMHNLARHERLIFLGGEFHLHLLIKSTSKSTLMSTACCCPPSSDNTRFLCVCTRLFTNNVSCSVRHGVSAAWLSVTSASAERCSSAAAQTNGNPPKVTRPNQPSSSSEWIPAKEGTNHKLTIAKEIKTNVNQPH